MSELKWCCELTDKEKSFRVNFRRDGLHFSLGNYFTSFEYDTTIPFDVTKGICEKEGHARQNYNNVKKEN